MTDLDEARRDEQVVRLVHDLRQCLHVIGLGTALLPSTRADDREFAEICESIEFERRTAVKLVGELFDAARAPRE